jgi:hypothetical protein
MTGRAAAASLWETQRYTSSDEGDVVHARAMVRGDLRPEVDPRLMLRLVPALMTYRVLPRDPLPDAQPAELLVDTVLMPLLVGKDPR